MSRDQRRRLLRQLRDAGFTVGRGLDAPFDLGLGPNARMIYLPAWPDLLAAARDSWTYNREKVQASCIGGPRWAELTFDWPLADVIPGPRRDALVAAGKLSADEAGMMTSYLRHVAYRAIRDAGSTLGDWSAGPDLAARTVALCGWPVFDAETLADIGRTDEERMAKRHQDDADLLGQEIRVSAGGILTTYRPHESPTISAAIERKDDDTDG